MKHELTKHLIPLLIIFIATSIIWLFGHVAWYNFLILFFGFGLGSFFLDTDHLIYWFFTHKELEESRIASLAIKKGDYRSVLTLLEAVHKKHIDLIFHHIIFQLVLVGISLFLFTSTDSIFGKSFLLALNIHLLLDEYVDLQNNPAHLQQWLFARLPKQLPISFLMKYLYFITFLIIIFSFLLIKTK